jgi:hypothetical protein
MINDHTPHAGMQRGEEKSIPSGPCFTGGFSHHSFAAAHVGKRGGEHSGRLASEASSE